MERAQSSRAIVISLCVLVALACTCSVPKLGGPAPEATVPISRDASERMQEKIDEAAAQSKSEGQFDITVTDAEVSSYLVEQLEKSRDEGDVIPLANPQVRFTQGQAWVYATFGTGSAKARGLVVVLPEVQSGRLRLKIIRADFGAVRIPQSLLDQMNEQIQSSVNKQTSSITLTSIVIREGEAQVTGKRK